MGGHLLVTLGWGTCSYYSSSLWEAYFDSHPPVGLNHFTERPPCDKISHVDNEKLSFELVYTHLHLNRNLPQFKYRTLYNLDENGSICFRGSLYCGICQPCVCVFYQVCYSLTSVYIANIENVFFYHSAHVWCNLPSIHVCTQGIVYFW